MSDKLTIARPYAKAAFEYAMAHNELQRWSDMLQTAALIIIDPQFLALLKNPRVTVEQSSELLLSICDKVLNDAGRNFIQLLTVNRRLSIAPEIATLFEAYRAEQEKRVSVQVTSVFPLDTAARDKLAQALRIRLQRDVVLECYVDSSLLGGAVIRAGDKVIDGSVRGKLAKLARELQG